MTNQESPTITLVGHCTPDSFALTAAIRGVIPDAQVERADSVAGLDAALGSSNLLLVNRVLDGVFDNTSGIDLIANLSEAAPPAMLISNIDEAQQQALQVGAVPGFGKSDQRSQHAADAIVSALNGSQG